MMALDGHCTDRGGVNYVQPGVCLQAGFAMTLNTSRNTGVASDAPFGISDHNVIHLASEGNLVLYSVFSISANLVHGFQSYIMPIVGAMTSTQRLKSTP